MADNFRPGIYFAPLLPLCLEHTQAMGIKVLGRQHEGNANTPMKYHTATVESLRDADYNAARKCDELCCDWATDENEVFLRRHGIRHDGQWKLAFKRGEQEDFFDKRIESVPWYF